MCAPLKISNLLPETVKAPASFTLSADASSLGTIAKVEFYNGGTLLNTATTAPYSYTWNNVAAGTYSLMAKATDTLGQSSYSPAVNVVSASAPVVSLTSPAANATTSAPGSFTLTANAWGTSSGLKSVSFYSGTTLLGSAISAPYSYVWNNVAAGSYSLTALATDNNNVTATSGAVAVTVAGGNQPPAVSLTSPAANATANAPGSFTLTANATSAGSTVAKVDFYQGATLIGTATAAPYSFTWSNVPPGTYSITAKATDSLNVATSSSPVSVTVNAASVQAYYIHADQLDTPRAITDTAGNTVWQWDNVDPFGNNMANENPAGAGAFSFNLRFPGQYFDRETNTHYNINRDYDAAIGRYIQSDPIGLAGGINTYVYVDGNPIRWIDPLGLYWFRQPWQTPGVVGRERTIVEPHGPVSEFIEKYVPAGYTFGELHDSFVDIATGVGIPDKVANKPSMMAMYVNSVAIEVMRTLGILDQPTPPAQPTQCK